MRGGMLVIGLGVLELLSVTGCWGGYGYRHRGYYGTYGYGYGGGAVVYNTPPPQPQGQVVVTAGQPPPPQGQVQVQVGQPQPPPGQPQMVGEGIAGSDGTRGWRIAVQAPNQEFQRLSQLAARANCQIEASNQTELKAMCNGNVHVVVRFDQGNVYKLCAPNTDPNVCAQVWTNLN